MTNFYVRCDDGLFWRAKVCTGKHGCGRLLQLSEFGLNPKGVLGRQTYCTSCANAMKRKRREDPDVRAREQAAGRQYYNDHREYFAEYREDHRDEQKQYYDDHRDELLVRSKEYYDKHREELLQYQQQYRQDNLEAIRERDAQYREDHREDHRAYDAQRYQEARTIVFDHYGWQCQCCHRGEPEVQLSLDHRFGGGGAHRLELFGDSNSTGGVGFYLWVLENGMPDFLRTLCVPCNAAADTTPTTNAVLITLRI